MELDPDLLDRLEHERAHVGVGLVLVAPKELDSDLHELLGGVRQHHAEHLGRPVEPVVVGGTLEQVELLLLRVPVGADTFERAGAVVESVGHDPEPYVVVAGELPFEEDPAVGVFGSLRHARLEVRGLHAHLSRF